MLQSPNEAASSFGAWQLHWGHDIHLYECHLRTVNVDDGSGSISNLGSTYGIPDEAGDDATPSWLTGRIYACVYLRVRACVYTTWTSIHVWLSFYGWKCVGVLHIGTYSSEGSCIYPCTFPVLLAEVHVYLPVHFVIRKQSISATVCGDDNSNILHSFYTEEQALQTTRVSQMIFHGILKASSQRRSEYHNTHTTTPSKLLLDIASRHLALHRYWCGGLSNVWCAGSSQGYGGAGAKKQEK